MARAKRMEFSKKVVLTVGIIAFFNLEIVILASFFLMFKFGDLTPLTELIIGVFAVITAIVTPTLTFYFWKSRVENEIKLKSIYGESTVNEVKGNNDLGDDF